MRASPVSGSTLGYKLLANMPGIAPMNAIPGYSNYPATNQARRAVATSRETWIRW